LGANGEGDLIAQLATHVRCKPAKAGMLDFEDCVAKQAFVRAKADHGVPWHFGFAT
jgi:hypothetical protein